MPETEIDLRNMSAEELEALSNDMTHEEVQAAAEVDETTVAAETEKQTETVAEVTSETPKKGDLNGALTEARAKERQERDARIAAQAELNFLKQQLQSQQAQSETVEEEVSFLEDPDLYIQQKLDAQAKVTEKKFQAIEAENTALKIAVGEAALSKEDLKDYRELVNLQDPNHFFKQYVDSTPGALRQIFSQAKPVQFALNLARNLKMNDPEYAKSREEALRAEVRKEVLKELQTKVVEKTKADPIKGPRSVSSISSATSEHKAPTKDPRKMTSAELEDAVYE